MRSRVAPHGHLSRVLCDKGTVQHSPASSRQTRYTYQAVLTMLERIWHDYIYVP
jgi:hypothetical protein